MNAYDPQNAPLTGFTYIETVTTADGTNRIVYRTWDLEIIDLEIDDFGFAVV